MGQLSMRASFLFTAPVTGTFFCQIRAQTDAPGSTVTITINSGTLHSC